MLYRWAARLYVGSRRIERPQLPEVASSSAQEMAPAAGRLSEGAYGALLERLRRDLAVDARLAHVEDLVGHLDRRIDRLLREIAKGDPATRWEPPGDGEEGSAR